MKSVPLLDDDRCHKNKGHFEISKNLFLDNIIKKLIISETSKRTKLIWRPFRYERTLSVKFKYHSDFYLYVIFKKITVHKLGT